MARKSTTKGGAQRPAPASAAPAREDHPDHIAGILGLDELGASVPVPGGLGAGPLAGLAQGFGAAERPVGPPFPTPFPLRFCSAVSGRYSLAPHRPVAGPRAPVMPFNLVEVTVRVDVDRFFPQNRLSIEVGTLIPRRQAHAIAEVVSDECTSINKRTIRARITYRDGDESLIPATTVTFRAERTDGLHYGAYTLELSGEGDITRSYRLDFESPFFDPVEFEVDRVENAGAIIDPFDIASHDNRPADMMAEPLSLRTVFQRAGFDVTMAPPGDPIPVSDTGTDTVWSDAEMHNAMVTYWSRFADRPQWALWVLYAARHERGPGLGGSMFDDIGPNHRQGTAIFTDSFINNAPDGDAQAQPWRDRMQFWTAVHEMGHAFNLAHAWQKALGRSVGAPGDPWIPLANEPESRSFMNYPFRVDGEEAAFFSDFRYRFSDDELLFMRHAPRRFVRMGDEDWFVNHNFEAPEAGRRSGRWRLDLRPNRAQNHYRFLEPVMMELKLSNTGPQTVMIERDLLSDGGHITLYIAREEGIAGRRAPARQWRPMVRHCHRDRRERMEPGEAVYGTHMISVSPGGWLIDEPGVYHVQAAIDMGDEIVMSNVQTLRVSEPASGGERAVAPDYFTEDVARVLAFRGAPFLDDACDVLLRVAETCAGNPAVRHARIALSTPMLQPFKVLEGEGRGGLSVRALDAEIGSAAAIQAETLLEEPDEAAETLGHIPYFSQLRNVSEALEARGDDKGAVTVLTRMIEIMKARDILPGVITNAEARLKRRL